MQGTVDGFGYGLVTPVVAYLMACLGGALGLRCTVRSLLVQGAWRPGWLALGSAAIGSGIWTMHFVAMMGFTIEEAPIRYDPVITFASLGVAIVMAGIGIFTVGYRGATVMALFTGGTVTGLGVASTHYLGMAGMRLRGSLQYDTFTVAFSVVIAVVAATAALWATVQMRGFLGSLGAGLLMGLAAGGMHYTGMAALKVHVHGVLGRAVGDSSAELLAPMLIGPLAFLVLVGLVLMYDPMMVLGKGAGQGAGPGPGWSLAAPRPGVPAHGPDATGARGGLPDPRRAPLVTPPTEPWSGRNR